LDCDGGAQYVFIGLRIWALISLKNVRPLGSANFFVRVQWLSAYALPVGWFFHEDLLGALLLLRLGRMN
jgi:hypothetical protein